MPVTSRSQSRLAATVEQGLAYVAEEYHRRHVEALNDFPCLALRQFHPWVEPLTDRRPERSILLDIPAITVLPRRWIVERFIFGTEVSDSLPLGAKSSVSVGQSLELKPPRRFRRGALQVGTDLD